MVKHNVYILNKTGRYNSMFHKVHMTKDTILILIFDSKSTKIFKDIKGNEVTIPMERVDYLSDEKLEELWDRLSEVAIDEEECICDKFLNFEKGSHREDVWKWFDKLRSKGAAYLVNDRERDD